MSLSKNINPRLVLVEPRKTRPFINERLLMGHKKSNQRNKQNNGLSYLGTEVYFIGAILRCLVQLKNMYSYLNSSLKLSDIVRGLSCKQSYCN